MGAVDGDRYKVENGVRCSESAGTNEDVKWRRQSTGAQNPAYVELHQHPNQEGVIELRHP